MKVKIKMSRRSAKKLLSAIESGDLRSFRVSSARVVTEQPMGAVKTAPAKYATVKKAAARKAPALKLSDTQKILLRQIADAQAAGLVGTQRTAKALSTLQAKKLIKKGKKEGDHYRYFITKLGEKNTIGGQAGPAPSPSH
jgi:hypothetical protein